MPHCSPCSVVVAATALVLTATLRRLHTARSGAALAPAAEANR